MTPATRRLFDRQVDVAFRHVEGRFAPAEIDAIWRAINEAFDREHIRHFTLSQWEMLRRARSATGDGL